MASNNLTVALFAAALLLLVSLHPPAATASDVCRNVECGKGKCVASRHSTVGFVCKCHSGWLQSALTGDTDGNDFLPCVYPNCSLNLNCASSDSPFPAPTESPPADDHTAVLNPCSWVSCEKGSCEMKSAFKWTCGCPDGYYNIDGNLAFPCFAPCVIGSDCSKLGVFPSNRSSSPPGAAPPASPIDGVRRGLRALVGNIAR